MKIREKLVSDIIMAVAFPEAADFDFRRYIVETLTNALVESQAFSPVAGSTITDDTRPVLMNSTMLDRACGDMVAQGNKIAAIKLWRAYHGTSLRQSKIDVEYKFCDV